MFQLKQVPRVVRVLRIGVLVCAFILMAREATLYYGILLFVLGVVFNLALLSSNFQILVIATLSGRARDTLAEYEKSPENRERFIATSGSQRQELDPLGKREVNLITEVDAWTWAPSHEQAGAVKKTLNKQELKSKMGTLLEPAIRLARQGPPAEEQENSKRRHVPPAGDWIGFGRHGRFRGVRPVFGTMIVTYAVVGFMR